MAALPFPKQQLFILALCRICEPIAFMSIFPYIYYMVKSFKITSNDAQIAIYAGMVTSAFAFAEFSTSVVWGKLSDRIGRKPVLLTGLAGTGLSMLAFGFAPNLPVALVARALGGLLNGNIGVLQTTVAEVVKVKEHQPRAYAIMPFVWCLGSIIGSGLGGSLADPVANYPGLFAQGTIFDTFPYLLPNLVSTCVVVFSLLVGILFLEETHERKKHRRDPGLELGRAILAKFRLAQTQPPFRYSKLAEAHVEETAALIGHGGTASAYSSAETTPRQSIESCQHLSNSNAEHLDPEAIKSAPPAGTQSAFTKQVLLNVFAYGILAYHTIALEQLLPVLLSMKDEPQSATSPVKFTGGFGLPSSTIGLILSLQGVYQMAAQMLLFPAVVRKLGALRTFRLTTLTYPLLYLLIPYLVWLPETLRMPGLVVVLVWKVTNQALAYPSNMLVLTHSAPSLLVLGVINGVAASAASLSRAVGPTLAGIIQSMGLDLGYLVIPWWVNALVALAGTLECMWMKEPVSRDTQSSAVEHGGTRDGREGHK